MDELQIDMTPYVAAIMKVLSEPYKNLVQRLLADGRLKREEVEALHKEILERTDQLPELVKAELKKSGPAATD